MASIHLSGINADAYRRIRIAATIVGKSIKDFVVEACEDKISHEGIAIPDKPKGEVINVNDNA